ncbi:MAG: PEP-CTERM sorting domain-containing protein [Pseudomonadota bacterium]
MRKLLKALTFTGVSALSMMVMPVQAGTILFQDNFDADYGTSSLNFNSFANWNVDDGTVDYIRAPNVWSIDNCVGGCIDIDGSTGNGGRMSSKTNFNLLASNTYRISVDVSGNQRTDSLENLTIGLSSLISFSFNAIAAGDIFSTYSGMFSGFAGLSSLFLETQSNDNVGAVLDNVMLECVSCQPTSSVPEPGVFGLLALGLAGLGVMRKRDTSVSI